MYKNKRVLLIAGGGTLGTYVAKELLDKGAFVDVICLEDREQDSTDCLHFYKGYATEEYLTALLSKNRYDGIVNFVHYKNIEDYKKIHPILISSTDHLIFLSSYRVYADLEHPITEKSPRLLDVTDDKEFLENEDYALPKAGAEDYIRDFCSGEHWTVVRPVISFSSLRFDLFTYSQNDIFDCVGELVLPEIAKNLTAGIDWAGNSGKLIANLLFKPETYGEAYTVSSGQNLTWGEIAEIYRDELGINVSWKDEDTFKNAYPAVNDGKRWVYKYDRLFDRLIDSTKIFSATGLTSEDFLPIRDGLRIELAKRAEKA